MKGAKKLAEQLRQHRIFNHYELLMRFGGPKSVAIDYRRKPPGRIGMAGFNHTMVFSPRKVPLMDRDKVNGLWQRRFHGDKAESELAALRWVKDNFGYDPVETPFGGYTDPEVMKKARELAAKLPSPKDVVL